MNQTLKKIIIGSTCIISIGIWIYYGLEGDSNNNSIKNHSKENDES